MADPDLPSYDEDLFRRLNALKKSNMSLDRSEPILSVPRTEETPETSLADRLKSLRNGGSPSRLENPAPASAQASVGVAKADIGFVPPPSRRYNPASYQLDAADESIQDLLNEIGPLEDWQPKESDSKNINQLLKESGSVLASSRSLHGIMPEKVKKPSDEPVESEEDKNRQESDDDSDRDLDDEARQAEEILARIFDEVELERQTHPPTPPLVPTKTEEEADHQDLEAKESSTDELSLPAVPSQLPEPDTSTDPSRKSLDFESDITARMAALSGLGLDSLGLPSAPTTLPSKAARAPLPKAEEDFWCVICLDNATVLCHDCEEQLYCAKCWKEGHMGPDVGYEEKNHEWIRFKRPK